jgi:hypothetical protein
MDRKHWGRGGSRKQALPIDVMQQICYTLVKGVWLMIRKDIVRRGGKQKTHIRVVEGYRPGPGQATKQRTIRSFGYLEEQPDPVVFMAEVERFNETYKEQNTPLRIEAESNARMYSEENRRQNYGYKFLEAVYDLLNIDDFIENHIAISGFRGDYSVSGIFKFLVLLRILSPDSKRASFQMKDGFYGILRFPKSY